MRNKYDEVEARLHDALHNKDVFVDSMHFHNTMQQAKNEQKDRMEKHSRSVGQNAFVLARMGGSRFVLLQAVFFVLCMLILSKLFESFTISIYSLDTAIGAMSILSMLSSVPYLKRAKLHRMRELETASCTSPNMLVLAKVLPMLLSELGMLIGIVLFSISQFDAPTERVLLSALLPYLTVSTLSGFLLIWFDGEHLSKISLSVGASVFCVLLVRKELFPMAFGETGIMLGFVFCIVLAGISLLQMRQLMKLLVFSK